MPNYLFAYTDGQPPESEEAGQQVMQAWMTWFGRVGEALVDGGTPLGESKTVAADGSTSDGAKAGLGGYSIVRADDFAGALEFVKDCPHLAAKGNIQIYETVQIQM